MTRYGWDLLGENPSEIALGQIGRPWKAAGAAVGPVVAPAAFATYDKPGYAKLAFSLRVDPRGTTSSILRLESRVALTDAASLRRFRRYWMVIGPFSGLIRRVALRLLDTDLRQPDPGAHGLSKSPADRLPAAAEFPHTGLAEPPIRTASCRLAHHHVGYRTGASALGQVRSRYEEH